jgi:hypothetical protein
MQRRRFPTAGRRSDSCRGRQETGLDHATGRPAYVTRTVRGDGDAAERGLVVLVAQISDSPTSRAFGAVGHARASTTLDIYAHYTQPADQRASTTLADSLDVHR